MTRMSAAIRILMVWAYMACMLNTHAHAAFDDTGVGARPVGMGSAFTAVADDAHATYYNPSGLAYIGSPEFTSSYGRLFMGLNDRSNIGAGYVAYAHPLNKRRGTLGVAYQNLSLLSHYQENTFYLSYGRSMGSRLNVGASVKGMQQRYAQDLYTSIDPVFEEGYSRTGFSADAGAIYEATDRVSAALTLSNITSPDVLFLKTEDVSTSRVPVGIKAGVAYKEDTLSIAVDAVRRSKYVKVIAGAEKWFFNYDLAVRGGLGMGNSGFRQVTAGLSYRVKLFRLDYAFLYPLSGIQSIAGTHRASLTLNFGPTPWETRAREREGIIIRDQLKKARNEARIAKEMAVKAWRLVESERERAAREEKIWEKRVSDTLDSLKKAREREEESRFEARRLKGLAEKDQEAWDGRVRLAMEQAALKIKEDADKEIAAVKRKAEEEKRIWEMKVQAALEEARDAKKTASALQNRVQDTEVEAERAKEELMRKVRERERLAKQAQRLAREKEEEKKSIRQDKGPKLYTIQRGDTLESIAEKFYGDPARWIDIYIENKSKVKRGSLTPDTVIIIP